MSQSQTAPPKARTTWRGVGIAGLAAVALLLGGQGFIQAGGTAEPSFLAPAAEIQRYYQTRHTPLYSIGSYLELLGLLGLLWFVCGLYGALRADLGQRLWLPTVALASGTATVGALLVDGWQLAMVHPDTRLDPQLSWFAFDIANLNFANAWIGLGSFAIAAGWAITSARSAPRWIGWWAVAAGVALIAARAVWTAQAWYVAYTLFWLWVIVVSVWLLASRQLQR
jgi:hypothetical protein